MAKRLKKMLKNLETVKREWDKKLFDEMCKDKPCKAYVYNIHGRLDTLNAMIELLENEIEEVEFDELYVRIGKNRKSTQDRC